MVIVVLWVLGGTGLVMQAYSSTSNDPLLESIKVAFLVLGGLGVVLPTYLNIWQSIENNKVLNEKIAWDCKENSFHLIEKWDNPAFLPARRFIRRMLTERPNHADATLVQLINEDADLKQSMFLVMNYWDEIRVSIIAGRIDEDLVRLSLQQAFLLTFEIFSTWIKFENVKQPRYFDDIEWLYLRWRNRPLKQPELPK